MPTVAVRLTPDQAAWLEAQVRPFRGKSDVVRDLIDDARLSLVRGLTRGSKLPAYCVGAGTSDTAPTSRVESSQELPAVEGRTAESVSAPLEICHPPEPEKKGGAGGKKIDLFARRALDPTLIPEELLDCQQLLTEFWSCKKGTRSQAVFTRVCNKLRAWDAEQRREALERAIASGWGDIFEPPSARANAGQGTGYVDSITRDRIEREKFLTMFSATTEAA